MEKLFFAITRWLMLIGTVITFIFLIGGSIYAFKLYNDSKDTEINLTVSYTKKEPKINFNDFKQIHQEKIQEIETKRKKIEQYVIDVIKNGSSGHGYALGNMPGGLIKDINKSKKIASYISKKLQGEKPASFAACIACHGKDGKGLNGQSPNLIKLPIYNGLVTKKANNSTEYAPIETKKNNENKNLDPLERYSAKLAEYINKYAITVGQEGTTVKEITKIIKKLNHKYEYNNFVILQSQLENNFKLLLDYGNNLKKTNKDTSYAINWREFLNWFLDSFDNQIKQEESNYRQAVREVENAKRAKYYKAQTAKSQLHQLLMYLAGALVTFILLTMILVLFQIEINTRKDLVNKEDE